MERAVHDPTILEHDLESPFEFHGCGGVSREEGCRIH